jgi:hypothetical protein
MRRLIAIASFLGILTLLSQCIKKEKTPVGAQFFEWGNRGSEADTLIYAQRDTFYQTSVPCGEGAYVYIGHYKDNKSRGIIRFADLPEPDTVDSARVTLYIHRLIGNEPGSLVPAVYTISQEWEETDITTEEFESGGFQGTSVDIDGIYTDSDSITFLLPTDIVQLWIDTTTASENYGLLLEYAPPDTGFLVEFYSEETPTDSFGHPTLRIRMQDDTTNYSHIASADAFIATTDMGATSDWLYIANGTALRTLLYFDVNWLPDNATINSAILSLYADTLLSYPDNNGTFNFNIFITSGESWEIPTVTYDSTAYMTGTIIGDSASTDITFFIQNWVTGTKENHGLILMGSNQLTNLNRRVFYSSQDMLKQPRLRLFYSLPPTSRYEE